jgi:hypothetical protein
VRHWKKQTGAIDAIKKSCDKQQQVHREVLEKALAAYEESEGKKAINDDRDHSMQKAMCWAAWLTFLAAAFYGFITYALWKDTNINFRMQQRAWVGLNVSKFGVTKNPDGRLTFTANGIIRNSGSTPALRVSTLRTFSLTKPSDQPIDSDKEWDGFMAQMKQLEKSDREVIEKYTFSRPEFSATYATIAARQTQKWNGEGGAVAPGSESPVVVIDNTLPDPRPDMKPQAKTIYWLGRITYRDIFSEEIHTTKFCVWYAQGIFELCPTGNVMD